MSAKRRTIMETGTDAAGVFSAIAFYLFGPLVWAGHLAFVYGPQSAMCAFGGGGPQTGTAVVWVLGGVTAASLAVIATAFAFPGLLAIVLRFRRVTEGEADFAISVMRFLAFLSFAGVAFAGAAALFLDPCAQMR